jgi:hypothetical protein
VPGPAEPNSALAHWVMPPIAAAIVLCAIGALGIGASDAWLVPSLGSAVFIKVMITKEPRASRSTTTAIAKRSRLGRVHHTLQRVRVDLSESGQPPSYPRSL